MKGFTLLEVIIALVIAGIAASVLFEATASGLHATQTASMYDQAIVRAKSRLAAATRGTKLTAGDWRGDDGGGFRWRVGGRSAVSSRSVRLDGVSVWIAGKDGGPEHDVHLDTEQVGG